MCLFLPEEQRGTHGKEVKREGVINSRRRNEELKRCQPDRTLRLLALVIVPVKGGDTRGGHDTDRRMDRIRDFALSLGSIIDM